MQYADAVNTIMILTPCSNTLECAIDIPFRKLVREIRLIVELPEMSQIPKSNRYRYHESIIRTYSERTSALLEMYVRVGGANFTHRNFLK